MQGILRRTLLSINPHNLSWDELTDYYFIIRTAVEDTPEDILLWQKLSEISSFSKRADGLQNSMYITSEKLTQQEIVATA